jgi:hypothetical protein
MTWLLRAPRARVRSIAAVAVSASALLLPGVAAWAAFTGNTTTGAATYSTKRIYTYSAISSSHDIGDASGGGAEERADDPLFEGDGTSRYTTGAWPLAFDAARHIDLTFVSPLPPGLTVTSPRFVITFGSVGSSRSCVYVQIFRRSTMTSLGQTDPNNPSCADPATARELVVVANQLNTTDKINDVLLRVVVRNDAGDAIVIDRAQLDGSTPYSSFVLHRSVLTDTSGAGLVQPWSLIAADNVNFKPAAGWPTAFALARYVRFSFPSYVPAGSEVQTVMLHHAYRPQSSGVNTCYYVEVYSTANVLLGTHGSQATPYCNSAGTNAQDDISLPELTGTGMPDFYLRFYWRIDTPCTACYSLTDLLTVDVTYSLT